METATQQQQVNPLAVVRRELEAMEGQFARVLPPTMPPERFTRVVLTAVQNDLELLRADRQSLWNAAMRAAEDGLNPDGRDGVIQVYNTKVRRDGKEVWIKKAQWMPMVGGIMRRVRNSGQIKMITARVVYAGDTYRFWIDGDGEHLLYEENVDHDTNTVVRVFAAAKTKDDELLVEPLSADDVEKIRNVSKARNAGPWVDWWSEMARKSALRRLFKRLPQMPEDIQTMIRREDELVDLDQPRAALAQAPSLPRITNVGAAFDAFAHGPSTTPQERAIANEAAPATDEDGVLIEDAVEVTLDQTETVTPAEELRALTEVGAKGQIKTADAYETYTNAIIASAREMGLAGVDQLETWWKSQASIKQRNAAGMTSEQTTKLMNHVRAAITAMRNTGEKK